MLVVLLALGLVLAGCDTGTGGGSGGGGDDLDGTTGGSGGSGDNLDGTTWMGSGGFLDDATLTLNYPNFEIVSTAVNETGTYTVSGTTVTFTESSGETLTGSISGNTLTVTFTIFDLPMKQMFTKKAKC
jgi:hypothetical protein